MSLFSGGGKGNSDSKTSTANTAYNQQSGASSGSVSLGANSTGNSVTLVSEDKDVLQSALQSGVSTTADALASNVATTSNAIQGQTVTSLQAIAGQNDALHAALASNNNTATDAFNLAGGAVVTVADALSHAYDQNSKALSDATQQGNDLNQYLASHLTATLDKAVPQTDAAQSEVAQKYVVIVAVAAIGAAAIFFASKHK